MATYLELVELVQRPAFRSRVQYALWSVCADTLADAGATAQQKQFARNKLKGMADNDELLRLAIHCAANPAIAAVGDACADSDIKAVVSSVFALLVV